MLDDSALFLDAKVFQGDCNYKTKVKRCNGIHSLIPLAKTLQKSCRAVLRLGLCNVSNTLDDKADKQKNDHCQQCGCQETTDTIHQLAGVKGKPRRNGKEHKGIAKHI